MSQIKKRKQDKYALSKGDIDFYKMTGVFAIVCVFIMLTLNMQGSQTERIATGRDLTYNFYMFCRTPLFLVIAGVALVGSLSWFIYSRVKKLDESKRVFTSTNCLAIVLYLGVFAACFGIQEESTNHGFFIAFTIVAALMYFASKFYSVDFVVYSVVTALFAAAIQLWAMVFDTQYIVLKIVTVLIGAVICILFHKQIGSFKVSRLNKASLLKFPVYIPLALGTVFLFWAGLPLQNLLFLNRILMLMVLIAQYIVFAIIYTIRRIKD